MASETTATAKTPGGVARAAPARVPSSVNTPAVVEEPYARDRGEATYDKILAALAALTDRVSRRTHPIRRHLTGEARVFAAHPG